MPRGTKRSTKNEEDSAPKKKQKTSNSEDERNSAPKKKKIPGSEAKGNLFQDVKKKEYSKEEIEFGLKSKTMVALDVQYKAHEGWKHWMPIYWVPEDDDLNMLSTPLREPYAVGMFLHRETGQMRKKARAGRMKQMHEVIMKTIPMCIQQNDLESSSRLSARDAKLKTSLSNKLVRLCALGNLPTNIASRNELAMLVQEGVKIGHQYGNVQLLNKEDPHSQIWPSKNKVKRDMIKLDRVLVKRLLPTLQEAKENHTISFTTDLGNKEHSGDHYQVITAHWINENFEMQTCRLGMKEFNECVYELDEDDKEMIEEEEIEEEDSQDSDDSDSDI